jgi:tetratricopeptide (TPR) repeat protein
MDSGQYDLAQQDFKKAIKLNPQYLLALINSSLIYIQTNEPQKATDQLTTVSRIHRIIPRCTIPCPGIFSVEDFDLAILDWKKFAEVQGENPITLNWIGRCFIAKTLGNI